MVVDMVVATLSQCSNDMMGITVSLGCWGVMYIRWCYGIQGTNLGHVSNNIQPMSPLISINMHFGLLYPSQLHVHLTSHTPNTVVWCEVSMVYTCNCNYKG